MMLNQKLPAFLSVTAEDSTSLFAFFMVLDTNTDPAKIYPFAASHFDPYLIWN